MIIGCMYASKTSTLLSKIRQHQLLGQTCIIVNHSFDTRYDTKNSISTHDKVSYLLVMIINHELTHINSYIH